MTAATLTDLATRSYQNSSPELPGDRRALSCTFRGVVNPTAVTLEIDCPEQPRDPS